MDNIWYSSATLAAALKMSLRHYHISLRAGILPWFCTTESLVFAMPTLSSFPCLPHPFNLCWELRPSHALTPPVKKKQKTQHIWSDWFLNKGFKMMQLLWLDVAFVVDADASALLASHVSYPAKRRAEVAIKNSAAVKQRWDTPTNIHGDIQTEIYTNIVTLRLAAAALFLRNSCLRCAMSVFKKWPDQHYHYHPLQSERTP